MTDDDKISITESTKAETALDVAAFIGSAVPWIGGPVSNVLGGMSLGRKLGRVNEVLTSLANELEDFKSEASENYVKTEDFEDILEQTLKKVGEERNEDKRKLYKEFLANAIESPGEPYDDQLRLLRTFEQISPDHLCILKALNQEPSGNPGMMGSHMQTLRERLPEFDEKRIEDLVNQLNDLRVTNMSSLKVMMTGHGASDLRHTTTNYGKRIVNYICSA